MAAPYSHPQIPINQYHQPSANALSPPPYPPPQHSLLGQALHRAASPASDFLDSGADPNLPPDDSEYQGDGGGSVAGSLDENGKKKKNRAGHGVGNGGMSTTYTKNNKPTQWVPPPTFPYNLIPGRDLLGHAVPELVEDPPLSISWPPFREDGLKHGSPSKPKKKPETDRPFGDDTTPSEGISVDLDGEGDSVMEDSIGPTTSSKPKSKKGKTEKPPTLVSSKKPGYREKTEKAKQLEQEKEEREKEKADRAAAKAAAAAKGGKQLDKGKKTDKSGGSGAASGSGSSKKKTTKAVAFAANQGVRVDGARNAVVEEVEEEEEPEEEVIDTRLYCVCKQMYDDDRLMIACDNCDDWCHPGCVHLPEDDLDLVDLFFCPNCLATNPNLSTTYKTACVQCRRPARLPLSKFCSDECGIACVLKRVDTWSASLITPNESKSAAAKMTAAVTSRLEACSAVRFAKRREGLVSVEPTAGGLLSLPSDAKRLEETRTLDRLRANLQELKVSRVQKVKAIAAAEARLVLLDLTVQRNEGEGGTRCGYDARMGMDEDAWEEWVESDDGRRAFVGYGIGAHANANMNANGEPPAEDEEMEMEMRELEKFICNGPKKKCERHAGWQKLKKMDFDLEKDITERSLQKLRLKQQEIRRRIEDIEILQTPPDSAVGGNSLAQSPRVDDPSDADAQFSGGEGGIHHVFGTQGGVMEEAVQQMKMEDVEVNVLS